MTLTSTERNAFTAMTDQDDLAYGVSACLETPPHVFQKLDREFHFDLDLTANEANHLKAIYVGPNSPVGQVDALVGDWRGPYRTWETGFSNPPYGAFIPQILTKAIEESKNGFTSIFLLPMRAGGWYQNLVLPYADEVRHVKERIAFWYQGTPKLYLDKHTQVWKPCQPVFDSIVVIYRPEPRYRAGVCEELTGEVFTCPLTSVWSWK